MKSIVSELQEYDFQSQPLDALFMPQSIAVIGATEKSPSVGRGIVLNLIEGEFKGHVYPVNPHHSTLFGRPCYKTVGEITDFVDLAIIVVPAKEVPLVMRECAQKGVKTAIVISAGFKEAGPEGKKLEEEIVSIAKAAKMRLLGPNCLGLLNPRVSLNASFARCAAKRGSIAFISQSGALCTAVLDWSLQENIGFSSFVSVGSMADINWGDLIEYFGQDPETKSILMYVETVGDAKSFFSHARRVAMDKPIIVIKPGKSHEAQHASASHTGALAESDAIFQAACERVGILRMNTIEELFSMAEVLSNQALPKGPKLAVITNAGGPAVLATDAVVLEGAQLAPLTKETTEALSTFLPPAWSKGNPVDLLGDASAERYRQAASLVLNDPMVDGVLFILTPQDITDPYRTAEAIVSLSKTTTKTILASWMGGESVQKGHTLLANAGIPSFSYPDEAAKSFAFMWKYASLIQTLYAIPETDYQPFQKEVARQKTVREALQRYREEGKLTLSESESKEIMKMWGFSVLESFKAFSEEEAVKLARRIGYPVVLKLESNVVTHKAQMGGVQLNLEKEEEVRQAFRSIYENTVLRYSKEAFHGVSVQKMVHEKGIEVIVGSSTDPQVGPTIMFGAGGALVELFRDVTISLPPLNTVFASHILEKTKISKALKNKKSVVQFLVEFADLISSVSEIKECDLNPILVGDEGTLILDARIILFSGHPIEPILRPYPIQYVEAKTLLDGRSLLFRPIRSDDESLLVQFHQSLSDEVVRLSYLSNFPLATRASHKRLSRVCFSDFDQDMILLAEFQNNESRQIEGAVRLTRINETNVWDLKFVIPSVIRTSEICELFFLQMMKVAEQERVTAISASVLAEDSCLISLLEKHGFSPYGRQNHIRRYVTFSCVANS